MADKDFRVKLGLHVGANAYIEGNISSVDRIQMNIASPTAVGGAGQLAWNIDENTVDIGMNANTTLQLGQEQYYYVKNQTGSLIPDGTVVMANGTVGASGRIKVVPAIADGTFPSKYIIGITTEDIPNGGDGFVTAFGKIRNIDTSMFNEGDILYADPAVAGGLANTVPIAPNNIVTMAIVINKHANNGTLFVRPTYGSNIHENEDVHTQGLSDGQALVYVAANARFENKTVSGASSDSFKTISVAGQSNVVADSSTDVLTFVAGSGITITTDEANDAITFASTSGGGDASNAWVNANDYSTLLSARSNDFNTLQTAYSNDFSTMLSARSNDWATLQTAYANDFSTLQTARSNDYNTYITVVNEYKANDYTTLLAAYANDNALFNSIKSFNVFSVAGQSNVVADSFGDTITFVAGSGMTITTDATTDTITFASTGGGGGSSNSFSALAVSGQSTIAAQANTTLNIAAGSNIILATDPSSNTLTISATGGGGGGGVTWISLSSNYTASSGQGIFANTQSASWTLTLPSSPSTGDTIYIIDSGGYFDSNPLTVNRNGKTIMYRSEDLIVDVKNISLFLVYSGSDWRIG